MYNIFIACQHGFRKGKSVVTNLLELLDDITNYIDNCNNVDLITIDFFRAFDKISHNKLIYKLSKYGISGNLLGWIKDFLTNEKFNVDVGNCKSDAFDVFSFVPLRSKLSSLMYISYSNDIADVLKFAKVKMYADGLTVYAIINNNNNRIKLQNDLNQLCEWSLHWGLVINLNKCKVMYFDFKNCFFIINLMMMLSVYTCEKILGVFIDNKLTFSDHIFNFVKKTNNLCNTILSNLYNMDNNTLINLFKTYALLLLYYASVIYSPHGLMLLDSIESVQRHFNKCLHGLSNYYYADRLRITQLDSLEIGVLQQLARLSAPLPCSQ